MSWILATSLLLVSRPQVGLPTIIRYPNLVFRIASEGVETKYVVRPLGFTGTGSSVRWSLGTEHVILATHPRVSNFHISPRLNAFTFTDQGQLYTASLRLTIPTSSPPSVKPVKLNTPATRGRDGVWTNATVISSSANGRSSWNSDGTMLAYTKVTVDTTSVGEIWKVRMNGARPEGSPIQVTNPPSARERDRNPHFSPDGNRFVFTRNSTGGLIFTSRADGSEQRAAVAGGSWNTPLWVDSDSFVASKLGVGAESGLFRVRLDGTKTRISDETTAFPWCVTEDRQWLIYSNPERVGTLDVLKLYIRKLDGTGTPQRLGTAGTTTSESHGQIVNLPRITLG